MSKKHGTRYTYTSGCRCDKCRKANNAYMRQYQRNVLETTPHLGWRSKRRWEPWEDDLASDYTKSALQIAQMLERTPAAVSLRRKTLNARRNNKKEEQ